MIISYQLLSVLLWKMVLSSLVLLILAYFAIVLHISILVFYLEQFPRVLILQAIFYYAFGLPNDILGCCLWCLVLRTSIFKAWGNSYWIRREVASVSLLSLSIVAWDFCMTNSTAYVPFLCRVRDMISVRAGLKKVPWDGYLKYFRPSPKLTERKYASNSQNVHAHTRVHAHEHFFWSFVIVWLLNSTNYMSRQQIFAESVLQRLEEIWHSDSTLWSLSIFLFLLMFKL